MAPQRQRQIHTRLSRERPFGDADYGARRTLYLHYYLVKCQPRLRLSTSDSVLRCLGLFKPQRSSKVDMERRTIGGPPLLSDRIGQISRACAPSVGLRSSGPVRSFTHASRGRYASQVDKSYAFLLLARERPGRRRLICATHTSRDIVTPSSWSDGAPIQGLRRQARHCDGSIKKYVLCPSSKSPPWWHTHFSLAIIDFAARCAEWRSL